VVHLPEKNIFSGIPQSLIIGATGDIEKAKKWLQEKKATEKIRSNYEDFVSVFTDGSNVVSERRGCGVAIFSSISIKYKRDNSGEEIVNFFQINPQDTILIILPKYYVSSRANTIMRGLEYITAYNLIDDDITFFVFDGSYVTSLIEPRASIRDLYTELIRIAKSLKPVKYNEIIFEIIGIMEEKLYRRMQSIFSVESDKIYKEFFAHYYTLFEETYNEIENTIDKSVLSAISGYLQNYLFLFIEQNFVLSALKLLLDTLQRKNIPAIWISKDAEGRHLTRELKAISLSNDLALLDFILGNREFLPVSKLVNLSEIEPDRVTIYEAKEVDNVGKVYATFQEFAETLYEDYRKYEIVYAKLGGPVIQLSYPKKIVNIETLKDILGKLLTISKFGYPQPLVYVHNRSLLRERMIKQLAEGIYKFCEKSSSGFLCNLLKRSGRDLFL